MEARKKTAKIYNAQVGTYYIVATTVKRYLME